MGRKGFDAESIHVTVQTYRWIFVAAGAISAALGLLILFWPKAMGEMFATLMGIYAIAAGLLYGVMVVRGGDLSPVVRIARGFISLALIVGGILMIVFTREATTIVINVVGIALGVLWIAEGATAFMTMQRLKDKSWLLAYAIGAMIAGVIMLLTPIWDGKPVTWLIGFSLLGLGIAQIYRGATATPAVVVDVESAGAN